MQYVDWLWLMPIHDKIVHAECGWTAQEAAELLGYSLDNIYYLCKAGRLLAHYTPGPVGRQVWVIDSLELQPRISNRSRVLVIRALERLRPANNVEAKSVAIVLKMVKDIHDGHNRRWGATSKLVQEYIKDKATFTITDLAKLDPQRYHAFTVYCSREVTAGRLKRLSKGVYEGLSPKQHEV